MSEAARLIIETLVEAGRHPLGMAGVIMNCEREAGATIVPVGSTTPFAVSREDWAGHPVISVKGGEGRIVAILARQPGNGAFRRLVSAIEGAGLTPVVVEPMGVVMPAILRRWRWVGRISGHGENRVEEWRPRKARS